MDGQKHYNIDKLKKVFAAAPCGIGIFVAETRQPLFLNDAYYRLTGYTPEEYAEIISNEEQKLMFSLDKHVGVLIEKKFF
ncbi:MAG: hypothetical protein VB031_07095 [Eubacteriaceae bacterium]|nr:hypothetical protein [Eubacteriaceae bacterium]